MNLQTDGTYDKVYGDVGPGTNKFRQYWAEFNLDLGGANLVYIPAFRTWTSSALNYSRVPAIGLAVDQDISTPKDEFMTHELRLASQQGGKLKWQIGALYYQNDLRSIVKATDGYSGALLYNSDVAKKTTAAGVFGEATYALADTTRLNAGLRYDYTKVAVDQTYTANLNLCCGGPLGSTTYGYPEILQTQTLSGQEGKRTYRNVTYKVRLEHDLSPRNLLYALTSSGFSPGDLSVTTGRTGAPTAVEFKTETLTSYEVGSKNRFFGNRLQVNGSAFYYVYGGYQVGNINISDIIGLTAFTAISAPARAYGGEPGNLLPANAARSHRNKLELHQGVFRRQARTSGSRQHQDLRLLFFAQGHSERHPLPDSGQLRSRHRPVGWVEHHAAWRCSVPEQLLLGPTQAEPGGRRAGRRAHGIAIRRGRYRNMAVAR
ncbi:TonB-dependent receptor [Sphingomonas aurantiaca]|uniref:TonB-dependent receptor domain-containing protein n=1 Tax=Sphingomonas aurantiaca TaxID=185949 RepID=UPI002FE0971F